MSSSNIISMEEAGKQRAWSDLDEELLCCILSRLDIIGDYLTFQFVCKSWNSVTPLPRLLLTMPLDHAPPLDIDSYQDPHLMYLNRKTNLFNFHDPTRSINYSLNIPQLLDDEIGIVELYYANGGWLLLGKGDDSYFFFNPSTKVIVDIPDTPTMAFTWMCFFGSPTSSNCQIIGIYICSFSPESIIVGTLKLGENSWSIYNNLENDRDFVATNCSPVVRNGVIYILGESGNLGKLSFPKGEKDRCDWDIIGRSQKQFMKFRDRFFLESDGDLICVATLGEGEVRVLKLDSEKVWENVENLKGKAFYVSHRTSFSRKVTVRGTSNKIYFPRFYDGKGVIYCLGAKKWRNFPQTFSSKDYYKTRGIFQCVWTKLPSLSS